MCVCVYIYIYKEREKSNFHLVFKRQISYTDMTNLLQFTIVPSTSISKLVWEDRVLFVWADPRAVLWGQQHPQQQFVWCVHLSLVNFALHPAPQTKIYNAIRYGDSNSCISVTIQNQPYLHTNYFSKRPILYPPKILTFPPVTPCIIKERQCSRGGWITTANDRLDREGY